MGPHRRGRRRRAGAAAMNALAPSLALDRPRRRSRRRIGADRRLRRRASATARSSTARMEPGGRARLRPARPLSRRRAAAARSPAAAAHRGPLAPVRQCAGLGRLRHRRRHPRRRRARRRRACRAPPGRWPAGSAAPASSCAAARFPTAGRPRRRLCQLRRDLAAGRGRDRSVDPAPAARRGAPRAGRSSSRSGSARDDADRDAHYPRLCRKRAQPRHAGLPARAVRGDARRVRRRCRHRHRLEGRAAARRRAQLLLQGHRPALLGRRHRARRGDWRANDLIYYEVMRHAVARGCTRVDFGRSKVGTGPCALQDESGASSRARCVYAVRTADGAAPREVNPLEPEIPAQGRGLAASCRSGSPTGSARSIARGLG